MEPLTKQGPEPRQGDRKRQKMRKVIVGIVLAMVLVAGCTQSGARNKLPFAEYLVGEWRIETAADVSLEQGTEKVLDWGTYSTLITKYSYNADHTWESDAGGSLQFGGNWEAEGDEFGGYLLIQRLSTRDGASLGYNDMIAVIIDSNRMALTAIRFFEQEWNSETSKMEDLEVPQYSVTTSLMVRR